MPGAVTYWREGDAVQNMGDYLTELFLERVAASPPRAYPRMRLVGSVISAFIIRQDVDAAKSDADVCVAYWGCGQRDEYRIPAALRARCRFLGVRGPLTRDLLELPQGTPLGDPALFLPLLHEPRPVAKQIGTVCAPHINDARSDRTILSQVGADTMLRPGVPRSLEALLEAIDIIAAADFVLCGALHAAIIACAYGRPFAFYHGGVIDLPFKWLDFSALLDIPAAFVRNVGEGQVAWSGLVSPVMRRPKLSPLLEVFPGEVQAGLLDRVRRWDQAAGADR